MDVGISEPKCKAILLCEKTIIDAATGNVSLIGVFGHFQLDQIPGETCPATAFLQFTDAEGRYELVIEVHDIGSQRVVARATGPTLEIPDRLMTANVIIPIPPLSIKNAGSYDVVIFANEKEIDRQKFGVKGPPQQGEQQDG